MAFREYNKRKPECGRNNGGNNGVRPFTQGDHFCRYHFRPRKWQLSTAVLLYVGMGDVSNGKVLYLDDDDFFVKIYKSKFIEKGYSIKVANTVDEALEMIHSGFVPDAIIFDLEMKGKDGFVFLQTLRDQHLVEGAYLIALTNHSAAEDKQRAFDLGTDMYIVKAEMIPSEVLEKTMNAIENLKTR